ncbi:MAG: WD40/YVTN/BNR-like repeat-containing protein [Thermoanaerobaculia bacterium]
MSTGRRESVVVFVAALFLAAPLPGAYGRTAMAGEADETPRDYPAERAEWNAMFRRDREGRVLAENRLKALGKACEMPVDPSMAKGPAGTFVRSDTGPSAPAAAIFAGTTWQSVGPMPMQSYTAYPPRQYGNLGGRVDAIAVHPTDPSILLLGSATGGIWKSTDAGQTWRPVSDYAPALAISHVAFSPANPSIVFAATGEADNGTIDTSLTGSLGTYLGGGLLKSTDGGETWFRVDTNLPANAIISRVVPHPTDVQRVVVGVFRSPNYATGGFSIGGIYWSTNGGVTFTATYSHRIVDLIPDPNAPDRLFLSTGGCNGCSTYGVLVSSNFGGSWQTTSLSFSSALANIKLGISRTTPAVLYASVLATDWTHSGSPNAGIFVSQDGGATWQKKGVNPCMCPASGSSCEGGNGTNQCDYDHFISPDPLNPGTVYFGSVSLYKSTDFGGSWVKQVDVYATSGLVTVHPDQHAGAFGPPGTLLVGNDGGVYRSQDGASTFENLNTTLNVSQFNGIGLHPTNPEFAIAGTQDNGNQRYVGAAAWSDRTTGDGGFSLIRTDDPSRVFCGYVKQGMRYSSDGGDTFIRYQTCDSSSYVLPIDCTDKVAFYPPAAALPSAPGTVLFGTSRVWYNETFGEDPSKWVPLTSAAITSASGDYLTAVEASSDLNGTIWAGSQQGFVYISPPGDANFHSVGGGLPDSPVTKIISVTADGRTAYVTFAGYLGSPSTHVFRTTDGGATWTNISSNLPDVPVLTMAVDPRDPTDLFVGTDVGVFRSTNAGASWSSFNAGLPNVPVFDLKFHAGTNDLWAATYGRGVWRIKAGSGVAQGLTLSRSRVLVTVDWQNPYSGQRGTAYALPQNDQMGFFYYTDPNNPEVFAKVLDFGSGSALCFVGGLTDFYYKVTFTMLGTGQVITFEKPPYQFIGFVDNSTLKFAGALATGEASAAATTIEPQAAAPQTLAFSSGRVSVIVDWQNPYSGETGRAYGIPKADPFGFFYYTDPSNPEVFVKVLDFGSGSALVFVGGLTDFYYKVTFTVLGTGQTLVFEKPPYQFIGFVDNSTLKF